MGGGKVWNEVEFGVFWEESEVHCESAIVCCYGKVTSCLWNSDIMDFVDINANFFGINNF